MNSKLVHSDGLRTFVVVFDKDEEAISGLTGFCEERGVRAGSVTAIGAFSRATIGYFDRASQSYLEIPVDEQVEVLSLIGDIAVAGDGLKLHAHTVLGCRDGTTRGGHLIEGRVWPTLEVVVTEVPGYLQRRTDAATGLPLIDLEASG